MTLGPLRHKLRWYAKKSARWLVASLSRVIDAKNRRHPVVRVLTYHRFGVEKQDPFCVTPQDFERHLQLLADQERAVSLEQVRRFVRDGIELPDDACLVSIDDGMVSTFQIAWPLLEKYGVPAVAFVSSKLIGCDPTDAEERYMTWDELRQLASSDLIEIGSHAHSHRSLGLLPICEAEEEAEVSRAKLREQLDCEIRAFAYPFGTVKDFNTNTDEILKNAGYTIAFNSLHGPLSPGMNLISLPRVKVEAGESLSLFAAISRGALDRWRLIDDRLWRLQRVRSEIS